MNGPTSQDLWELFVDEATESVSRCLELLPAGGAADPRDWRLAAGLLEALEAQAALMGVPEVASLAQASKAFALAASNREGATEGAPLAAALQHLRAAFEQLRAPDASGAHLDPAPLREAEELLRGGSLAEQKRAPGPRPLPRRTDPEPAEPALAPAAPDDDLPDETAPEVWQPQVDADMVDPFIEECAERLESLSVGLVQLESTHDPELVRSIFRDLHTLKGSSAFVGLKRMNRLAHAAEDLVGEVRDGRRTPDRAAIDVLLAALDALRAVLDRAVAGEPIDVAINPIVRRLRDPEVRSTSPAPPTTAPAPPTAASPEAAATPAPPAPAPAAVRVPVGSPVAGLSLRVDFDKLDLLLNLVGELVLGKAGIHDVHVALRQVAEEIDRRRREENGSSPLLAHTLHLLEGVSHDLEHATGQLDMVSAELRDQVMKLRMVPIAGLFNKYRRVVRDLSHGLGKEVTLEIRGAETELDKLLVEQLDDPLLHLVRNAVDHGVEPPDVREAFGKPREGRLLLSASHRGHQIVIEVVDDGGGIEAERVGQKALDAGLIAEAELCRLDRQQVLELIFLPGLSTAGEVTRTSGRGVGMDVVREAIVGLKGSIEIDSTPGRGTRFTLKLPLTLAIGNVLLCHAGGQVLAVPIHAVKHTLMADPHALRSVAAYPTLRLDEEIPLIDVAATLGLPAATTRGAFPIALVEALGGTFGLVFDRLLGRQEIVIKGLGSLIERVPCCAGATLLGERCALILDVPALVRRALESPAGLVAREAEPEPAPRRGPMVLVVEDSDTVREDLRRVLATDGYTVHEARDGSEALELAGRHRFDLISTDVVMPGIDGYELCRRLRQLPAYDAVPIIMLTSRDQEIDRIQGFDAGVDAYLVKPVGRAEITSMIRRLLEASQKGEPA